MIKRIAFCLALIALPAFGQAQSSIQAAATPPSQASSGTFANKPAASAGALYLATDLGTRGVLLISDGTVWKPAAGSAVIGQSAATGMAVTGTLTETTVASLTIPAGLLSANGSLRITVNWTYTNSANSKTFLVRYGSSVGIAGTAFMGTSQTTTGSSRFQQQIYNQNSTSTQVSFSSGTVGFSSANTTVTSSVNTANSSALSFNGQLANTGETITLQAYTVEWLEP